MWKFNHSFIQRTLVSLKTRILLLFLSLNLSHTHSSDISAESSIWTFDHSNPQKILCQPFRSFFALIGLKAATTFLPFDIADKITIYHNMNVRIDFRCGVVSVILTLKHSLFLEYIYNILENFRWKDVWNVEELPLILDKNKMHFKTISRRKTVDVKSFVFRFFVHHRRVGFRQ